ncbi:MAG: hypothetical protein Kow00107_06860 [Planctomycetota bacterium]
MTGLMSFLHIEVTHDLGTEAYWVIGPVIRLGHGALSPCELRGSSSGAWIELQLEAEGANIISAFGVSRENGPVNSNSSISIGDTIIVGNAMVRLVAISDVLPPSSEVYSSQPEKAAPVPEAPKNPGVASDAAGTQDPLSVSAESEQPTDVPMGTADLTESKRKAPFISLLSLFKPKAAHSSTAVDDGKHYIVIWEKGSVARVEVTKDVIILGADSACDVPLKGERVARHHAGLSKLGDFWRVNVLGGYDRATVNGEFVKEAALHDGSWIVLGGSRIRFDKGIRDIEGVKPPPKLGFGAIFSPLTRDRSQSLGSYLRAFVRNSPLFAFSVFFHVVILVAFLFLTVKVQQERVQVDLSAAFDSAAVDEELIDEEVTLEELDEVEEVSEEIELEEAEMMELEGDPEGSSSFLDTGGNDMLPIEGTYGIGRLPSRPKKPSTGKRPTLGEIRKKGLEVLFVFDTTASMDYLLDDVKRNIDAIYTVTFNLVRTTRFAAVAYRDVEPIDEYVVKSMDFTGDITEIKDFLNRLNASGGGDTEEAVQEALKKASKLHWRKNSHRVIILFTDAPSHKIHEKQCFKWADSFRAEGGYLHTVHVKTSAAGNEETAKFLAELAQRGGGTFVPLSDEILILKKVFALVFPENSKEVEEALAEYNRKGAPPK